MATGMDIPLTWTGRAPLSEADPELQDIIRKEKNRQATGLELIASEVRGVIGKFMSDVKCCVCRISVAVLCKSVSGRV